MERRRIPVVVGCVLLLSFSALILYRTRLQGEPGGVSNAGTAHDPKQPRRADRVYQETLDGRRYSNRDLGLALSGPEDWKLALGARPDDTAPYEGLVVKMEPETPPDATTQVRPLVSLVKRSLRPGASRDPVAFIRGALLAGDKRIVEEPRLVDSGGRTLGRVVYEMPSGQGSIRILQCVWV